jgi:hypothetical protein
LRRSAAGTGMPETEMRRALVGGMDPVDAYNRYGKF